MSIRKNKSNRRTKSSSSSKRYTPEQKILYHASRDSSPGKHAITYGGPKHNYSFGFVDGVCGRDNHRGVNSEFGSKSANAYNVGHKRGVKTARSYFLKTGKQLDDVLYRKK